MKEKHVCDECLPRILPGMVEAGTLTIERDPLHETILGTGTKCDVCHFQRRTTYKITLVD